MKTFRNPFLPVKQLVHLKQILVGTSCCEFSDADDGIDNDGLTSLSSLLEVVFPAYPSNAKSLGIIPDFVNFVFQP